MRRASRLTRYALTCLSAAVLVVIGLTIYLLLASFAQLKSAPAASIAKQPPTFVGSRACATCHKVEYDQWLGSHHQLAMQPATAGTVLGDFDHATFSDDGTTSTFFRRDGQYMVRTAGPDGKLHDYPIQYTFGVYPLQQYLIPLPGGRLQAFTVAWDSRPRQAGGQRWFALYPGSSGDPSSPLYWSALDQTWNYSCAGCHSTDLRKHYNAQSRTYATTWTEMSVGCEACHGPGSNHIAWARHPDGNPDFKATKGLTIAFDQDRGVTWHTDPATGLVQRSRARTSEKELATCAACHALRMQFHEDIAHGQPLGDDYRVELLTPQYYFPDGQIKGEVFEYGSFIQSRMFHAGVTCTNCHNPHTATLRVQGNRLCTSCHLPERYDTPKHTHHRVGSTGAQCVACHMPTRTYMRIDIRHDHSIRVPRPDLSVALSTPNACTGCHKSQTPQWAAHSIEQWFGPVRIGFQHFGRALHAGRLDAPGADKLLVRVIADHQQPAIARATALRLIARLLDRRQAIALFHAGATDNSPLVRRAVSRLMPVAEGSKSSPVATAELLKDPVSAVRLAAASSLDDTSSSHLSPAVASALTVVSAQYLSARGFNADRPEAHLNLASFLDRQDKPKRAKLELKTALSLDPSFAPAAVNLADLYRAQGRDNKAEAILRRTLQHAPDNPALHFALGLLQVRQGKKTKALESLATAARGAPSNPRFAYVYAIALNAAGKTQEAILVLEHSLKYSPYNRASLVALVNLCKHAKYYSKASQYRKRLRQLTADISKP